MPRYLKPKQVAEVRHPNLSISIPIMLDRESLEFFFEVAGARQKFDNADAAKVAAREKVKALATVEWQAVIAINHATNDGYYYNNGARAGDRPPRQVGLKLDFERFERGRFEGKWQLKRRHILDAKEHSLYEAEQRKTDANAGSGYYSDNDDTVIPYTEEAWTALHAIVAGVHALNAKLESLLSDSDKAGMLLEKFGTGDAARLLSAAPTAAQKAAKR